MKQCLIITPFKNSFPLFKKTYNSVLAQDYKYYKWIIVNDGSDKNQRNQLGHLVSNDNRILIIDNENSQGAGYARNQALEYFKHDYIACIDSDDEWDPKFLSHMIKSLEKNKTRFIFCGYRRLILSDDNKIIDRLNDFSAMGSYNADMILKGNPIACLTFLYKPKPGKDVPKFALIKMRNDLGFIYNALLHDGPAIGLPDILATYNIRNNSLSRNKFKAAFWQFYFLLRYTNLSLAKKIYFWLIWAFNGLKKYS